MSDASNEPFAFEPPAFPTDDEFEDDDDDLDDELDDDEVEGEPLNGVNRLAGGTARSVLEHLARSIVDEPDAVVIEVGESCGQTRLSLHVAPGDMGRVIGKRGRVAEAIRAVVRAAASRDGADASVDIVD